MLRGRWPLLHLLDEHPDLAAAGKPDPPGRLIRDAELQHFRLAAADHVDRLADDRALDAAARHRAFKVPLRVDDEMAADRTRRRPPRLDDGGERHAASLAAPAFGGGK